MAIRQSGLMSSATIARRSGRTGPRCSRRSRPISITIFPTTTRIPVRCWRKFWRRKAIRSAISAIFGVTFGMKAKAQDALEPYKPANWDQVAPGLKDPDGYWTTIHSGTLGLFVNKDALGGKPVPACWKDLLKPDYRGMVGYLDPSSARGRVRRSGRDQSGARRIRGQFRPGDHFLQGTAEERSDRSQTDILCPGGFRRDADPAGL